MAVLFEKEDREHREKYGHGSHEEHTPKTADDYIQSLWSANPDGTGLSVVFGNRVLTPATFMEARSIPDSNRLPKTEGLKASCKLQFMETFGRERCGVGRPSVLHLGGVGRPAPSAVATLARAWGRLCS